MTIETEIRNMTRKTMDFLLTGRLSDYPMKFPRLASCRFDSQVLKDLGSICSVVLFDIGGADGERISNPFVKMNDASTAYVIDPRAPNTDDSRTKYMKREFCSEIDFDIGSDYTRQKAFAGLLVDNDVCREIIDVAIREDAVYIALQPNFFTFNPIPKSDFVSELNSRAIHEFGKKEYWLVPGHYDIKELEDHQKIVFLKQLHNLDLANFLEEKGYSVDVYSVSHSYFNSIDPENYLIASKGLNKAFEHSNEKYVMVKR